LRARRVPDAEAEAKKGIKFMMEKPGGAGGGKEGGDGSVADWICDIMHDLWCDRNEGISSVVDKNRVKVQNQVVIVRSLSVTAHTQYYPILDTQLNSLHPTLGLTLAYIRHPA